MTEKQAALLTYVMWSWLEANPGKRKKDHPFFYELGFSSFFDYCPLCELFRFDDECGDCHNCPLLLRDMECVYSHNYNHDSPFYKWNYYSNNLVNYKVSKEASIAAGEIASVAWEEYKKLGG